MWLDLGFGVTFALCAWRGARQGFARQMLQLTGLGVGLMVAEPISKRLVPLLAPKLSSVPKLLHSPLVFFGVIFVVWLAISTPGSIWLAWYRKKIFGENVPSLGDRVFGACLGVAKAAAIMLIVVYALNRLPEETRSNEWVRSQLEGSRGRQWGARTHLVERVLASQEVDNLRRHVAEVIQYFRDAETADEKVPPTSQN